MRPCKHGQSFQRPSPARCNVRRPLYLRPHAFPVLGLPRRMVAFFSPCCESGNPGQQARGCGQHGPVSRSPHSPAPSPPTQHMTRCPWLSFPTCLLSCRNFSQGTAVPPTPSPHLVQRHRHQPRDTKPAASQSEPQRAPGVSEKPRSRRVGWGRAEGTGFESEGPSFKFCL